MASSGVMRRCSRVKGPIYLLDPSFAATRIASWCTSIRIRLVRILLASLSMLMLVVMVG